MKHLLTASLILLTVASEAQIVNSEMTATVESWLSTNSNPSVAGCIVKGGGILWMDALGKANVEADYNATVDTPYMLASVSKTYTGTALLKLISQGVVGLTESVNTYLPFEVIHPGFPKIDITVEQLLMHTAGIKDNWGVMPYCEGDCTGLLADFMEGYFTPGSPEYSAGANFQSWSPGSTYAYSNIGATLIGYLVEAVSGMYFSEYCENEIFTPMCMNDTHWFLAGFDDISTIATPYDTYVNPPEPVGHYGYLDYPDGQLRSSIRDVSKWMIMNLNNGVSEFAGAVLPEGLAIESMSYQFGGDQGYIWYSFTLDGDTVWGHNGGDLGVSSDILISKSQDIAIALISNGDDDLSALLEATYIWAKSTPNPSGGLIPPQCIPVNVENIEAAVIEVFPNPASEFITINLVDVSVPITVNISTITGKLLMARVVKTGRLEVDVRGWNSGIYLVGITSINGKIVMKVVVE